MASRRKERNFTRNNKAISIRAFKDLLGLPVANHHWLCVVQLGPLPSSENIIRNYHHPKEPPQTFTGSDLGIWPRRFHEAQQRFVIMSNAALEFLEKKHSKIQHRPGGEINQKSDKSMFNSNNNHESDVKRSQKGEKNMRNCSNHASVSAWLRVGYLKFFFYLISFQMLRRFRKAKENRSEDGISPPRVGSVTYDLWRRKWRHQRLLIAIEGKTINGPSIKALSEVNEIGKFSNQQTTSRASIIWDHLPSCQVSFEAFHSSIALIN